MTRWYKAILFFILLLFVIVPVSSATSWRYTVVNDTYVSASATTTNYDTESIIYSHIITDKIILLNFSIPAISTQNIQNATLYLYVGGVAGTKNFSVSPINTPWNSSNVTWDTKPTIGSVTNTSNLFGQGVWASIDISQILIGWGNGTIANYGIALTRPNADGVIGFTSLENINECLGCGAYIIINKNPVLFSPSNESTQTKTYPPQTTNINFTWSNDLQNSNLIIAKDFNFNLISIDTTTANNYSVQSLEAGNYWWKVRNYNSTSGTHGDYSATFNFTLSNTQTTSGTAIQGTVYELLNGVNTPISGATVYISNAAANWSSSQTVGSNGYYVFTGLTNGTTYYLNAKALGYNDGTTEYVTTGNGVWTTKDIPLTLCISGLTCYGTVNYVKFVATDFFGNLYSGLSVSVYKGADITTTYTATTGTDGAATFRLTKDQSYRLVFTGSAITSTTITITPGESILFYVFVAASTPIKWWDNTTYQEVDTVRTGVTTATVGGIAYVNVTYNDSLAQTTAWTVYLNQTNHTQPNASQIMLQSANGSGNFSQSFSIASGYAGESYLVNIVATHTTFGTIQRSFGVQFYGTKDGSLDFIPSVLMAIIAIAILVFVGGFFDSSNFAQGAGIVCVLGWIELGLGMFAYANMYISVGVGLTIASVIAIIANINERNKRETTG